ncbi:MAG: DnaJ domain-containing protein [Rhodobacterales bacterium]|nr:DnaJ domain-containing protein [Rhodobacterales bacterium]
MSNPYRALGVDKQADKATIRKAYKKLARKFHPDVNKDAGAEDRFKDINAAYDVLGDDKKRKLFDEFGEASTRPGFDANQARSFRGRGSGMPFNAGGGGVEDLLGSLFGAGFGGQQRQRRGQDQQTLISIPFMTIVLGGEQEVTLRQPNGELETVRIPIPAGANHGGKVRLRGRGLPPRGGGPCGDLIVELNVDNHPHLRRSGNDLELDVPITVLEAIQGASITVPTPLGDVKVTVPPWVKSGARLRLKNRGVQKKSAPGHLYLILRPMVPQSDTDEVLAAAQVLENAYESPIREGFKL